jgi:RecB family exonuclease
MPALRIVLGDRAQIEHALGEAIAGAKVGDPLARVSVLVDNSLLKLHLPRSLARSGIPQLNVRYFRPEELAEALASQGVAARAPRLTRDADRFLVREIAGQAGGYFANIAGREGFADALAQLFRELEMGGFPTGSLPPALKTEPTDATSKVGEIRRLFNEYLTRREGFAGGAEAYAAAAGVRLEGPLFVYGIWAPSQVQAELVERITSYADVTIFLPYTESDADSAHASFREWLIALRAHVHIRFGAPVKGEPFFPPAPNVGLVSAPDSVREVWEAARWCLDRAREGIAFHEMAIVYRNQDPYRALVTEIFAEAHIETYLHDGYLLSAHPYGRRLLSLLELAAAHETFERARVMEFLTETRIPLTTRAQYEDPDNHVYLRLSEWEAYTREAGIIEGIAQWQERLGRLAAEKRDESRNENREWMARIAVRIGTLARFAADFHVALSQHPDVATWNEHLNYTRSLAGRYAEDTEAIVEALDDLRLIAAVREHVTFGEFCRAVRDHLEWRDTSNVLLDEAPPRQFGRRGVAILDASSMRHLHFRAVYLLGVSERVWPPPPRPDPLLLEEERAAINATGSGLLPLRVEPDDEALTFVLALQAATEHLALSYARADAGRTSKHAPSYFFRRVVETLEGRRLSLDDLESSEYVRRIEAGRLTADEIGRSVSSAEYDRSLVLRGPTGTDPAAIAALADGSPSFAAAIAARRDRWSAALTPYDGVMCSQEAVSAAADLSPFPRDDAVSASQLETYATCPYRYFLRYGLGIEPVEPPEAILRMDHLQRGSLIHEILQRFLERIGRDDPPRPERRAEHLRILYQIAREAGEERVRRGSVGAPLIWAMDRRVIDEDLDRWYGSELREISRGGLLPGAFETRFGKLSYGLGEEDKAHSRDEPLTIEARGRRIKLLGRIDRIDWDDALSRFLVIDYKTGVYRKKGMFDRGESLQLAVYLYAAAHLLGLQPKQGSAQYFYATSRGEFKRHTVTGQELEEARDAFGTVLTTIAEGISSGYFAPNPEYDHCRFCDYRDVCDVRITRVMQRKTSDPRGAAYRALEGIA